MGDVDADLIISGLHPADLPEIIRDYCRNGYYELIDFRLSADGYHYEALLKMTLKHPLKRLELAIINAMLEGKIDRNIAMYLLKEHEHIIEGEGDVPLHELVQMLRGAKT